MSYHYKEASEYIEIKNHNKIENILSRNKIDYVKGKSWTTDAIYKETINKIKKRKEEGCIFVEMESSAIQSITDYLNIDFYTFFITGDILDSLWSRDDLGGIKEKRKQ